MPSTATTSSCAGSRYASIVAVLRGIAYVYLSVLIFCTTQEGVHIPLWVKGVGVGLASLSLYLDNSAHGRETPVPSLPGMVPPAPDTAAATPAGDGPPSPV